MSAPRVVRPGRAVHSPRDAHVIDPGSWSISPTSYADVRRLCAELEVGEVTAQVLVRRGFADPEEARAFLHPDVALHDPYLMPGVAAARRRIDRALAAREPIAVHGDYDADGITATFLLVSVLEGLGADVRWHLPNRFVEGYGVSATAVEELAARGRQAARHRRLRRERPRRGGARARAGHGRGRHRPPRARG